MERRGSIVLAWCLLGSLASNAIAGPKVNSVSLHALRSGGATTLTFSGAELTPEPKLLASFPIAKQQIRDGATPRQVEIEVTLDADVPAGIYQVRLANRRGVSAPIAVAIDALPQLPLGESIEQLPAALHGTVAGSDIARTQFKAQKGQRIILEVEARRLGSALNPLVHLYNDRRIQLAWAQGVPSLADDCRIDVEIPADGIYTIELHDALFRGANPGFFRLKVGEIRYADTIFPLAVQQGTNVPLTYASGNMPGSLQVESGKHDQRGFVPAPWPPQLEHATGGRPRLLVTNLPEAVEAAAGAEPVEVAVPAGLNGRLSQPGEEDRWTVKVTPGMALRFEVLAARAGTPLDGVLTIRTVDGKQLAASDDQANTSDPGLDFTVPAGVEKLVVALKDLQGRGGEKFVYRIGVTQAGQPDFSLQITDDRIEIPQQGTSVVRLKATRRGYNGPIRLAMDGLPESVTMSPAEIPAGASEALVSFSVSKAKPVQMLTRLIGKTAGTTPEVERVATLAETAVNKYQPWLQAELAAAITQSSPLAVAWTDASAETELTLGGTLAGKVTVTRGDKAAGPIRLTLLSSQIAPKKQVQNRQVDDPERTLRLDPAVTIAADKSEAEIKILVPSDLPMMPYDLAIQADVMSADGKRVLASAVTPVRRLAPARPSFELALAGEPEIEAVAGAGDTGRLKGKLVRKGGFARPVALTLGGLPQGVKAPTIVLQGDQTEFEFPVAFPFGTAAAELSGVKLVATSQLDPKTSIKSENEVQLKLKIVPGAMPMGQPPHALFEDQSDFPTHLTEGTSRAATVSNEKYSGSLSVQITPEQKFNPNMPGFGQKIRENPAPGEFRYLRFAWKKVGGQAICLQIAHDGKFGPSDGKPGKFRYHAGPSPECYGASLAVDPKLPNEWTVVTRDLFADFGEFTFTGIALSPVDGQFGYFDHIYLGTSPADFELTPPAAGTEQ